MPRPRRRPRARLSALRFSNPCQSAASRACCINAGEIAAVIGGGGRRSEGDLLRRHVVAPAQLDAVDAHLGGGGLHQPLHEVVALGPAGAAIGADGRGIGENALARELDERRPIDAHHVLDHVHRRHQRRHGREMRAHVAVVGDADGEEMPLGVERQLGRRLVVAAVGVGDEALRALVGPFDRPAEIARGVEEAGVFGIGPRLHPEGAAHIAGEHAHLVGWHFQNIVGDLVSESERALAADVQGPLPVLRRRSSPIAERGSIAQTTRRLLAISSRVT